VAAGQLIWDPGLGFAKTEAQCLELLDGLGRLRARGYPLLVGPSRKRFIGAVLAEPRPRARLWGTAAVVCKAIAAGTDIVRVHDVGPITQTARMADALWRRPTANPG
jgi:dihydropteroate synthase